MASSSKKGKEIEKTYARKIKLFIEDGAERRYEHFRERPIINERGFNMTAKEWSQFPDLQRTISKLHWELLISPRVEIQKSWVGEFYSNAAFPNDDGKIYVRGKYIDVSAEAINKFYKISKYVGNEGYNALVQNITNAQLATALTRDGILQFRGNSQNLILSKCLSRTTKVWQYIVSADIDPTKHFSDLTRERATMIYCILNNIQINVGQFICRRMSEISKVPQVATLAYPCLITELCKKAKVPDQPNDVVVPVTNNITRTIIQTRIKMPEPEAEVQPQQARAGEGGSESWANLYNAHYQRLEHLRAEERYAASQYNQWKVWEHNKMPVDDFSDPPMTNFNQEGYIYDSAGNPIIYPPAGWEPCQPPKREEEEEHEADEASD